MSSSVTSRPRSANSSRADSSRRRRLRSASARRGAVSGSVIHPDPTTGEAVSTCDTVTGELLSGYSRSLPMSHSADPHHDRRWLILGVIGIAQLLVVLDVTIVNIALPSAQQDLGFSDDARQWVIT